MKKTYYTLLALLSSSVFAASSSTLGKSDESIRDLVQGLLEHQTIHHPITTKTACPEVQIKAFQLVAEIKEPKDEEKPITIFCLEGHPELLTFITQNERAINIEKKWTEKSTGHTFPNGLFIYEKYIILPLLLGPNLKEYTKQSNPTHTAQRLLHFQNLKLHHVSQSLYAETQNEDLFVACTPAALRALGIAKGMNASSPIEVAQQMLIQSKEQGLFLTIKNYEHLIKQLKALVFPGMQPFFIALTNNLNKKDK